MSPQAAVDIARNAIMMALVISMPFLVAAIVVGILVSLFQAVTQIHEQTLTFVPKLIVIAVVFIAMMPWCIDKLTGYMQDLFASFPALTS